MESLGFSMGLLMNVELYCFFYLTDDNCLEYISKLLTHWDASDLNMMIPKYEFPS